MIKGLGMIDTGQKGLLSDTEAAYFLILPLPFLFGIIVSIPYIFELSVRSPMHLLPIHLLDIGTETCSIADNRAPIG